jgi:hypothetical protein
MAIKIIWSREAENTFQNNIEYLQIIGLKKKF